MVIMRQVRKTNGFTLLEVLVAMMLLGIAAAGVGLPFATAAGVQREASVQLTAARLASDKLEQIRTAGYDSAVDSTEAAGLVKKADGALFTDVFYADFGRTVTCQAATVGGVEMKWVTAAVSWDGREITRLSTLMGPE